jgi:toxin-antitoxin system PIN domain toxin
VRFLLDVNVLMALLWENHEHHDRARQWLRAAEGFATCPITQIGFARVSSHPMLGYGMSPEEAFGVLRRFLADARHAFVHDDLSCEDRALLTERIPGAKHVTDHYLAALARQHGLKLATLDEPLSRAFPDEPALVALIPQA